LYLVKTCLDKTLIAPEAHSKDVKITIKVVCRLSVNSPHPRQYTTPHTNQPAFTIVWSVSGTPQHIKIARNITLKTQRK
jgi:hypothetical protein